MIKTITVAQCDVCGKIEPAKEVSGRYNECDYTIPDNWKKSPANNDFFICRECLKKLEAPILNHMRKQGEYSD